MPWSERWIKSAICTTGPKCRCQNTCVLRDKKFCAQLTATQTGKTMHTKTYRLILVKIVARAVMWSHRRKSHPMTQHQSLLTRVQFKQSRLALQKRTLGVRFKTKLLKKEKLLLLWTPQTTLKRLLRGVLTL
jgi:hypothetical protein